MATGTNLEVPAHIAARIAARGGAKSAMLDAVSFGPTYPKISIRASRYRLVDEGVETVIGTEMDVIFVAINPRVSKTYYDKPYTGDADDKSPPTCFSNDGITPDASVVTPINGNCASCPNNVLGSRMTPAGAQSKICGDIRHIAVVPAADPSKPYSLIVPVSAMKALRLYFKELSQYGLIPEEVITTLGFDEDASFPRITFSRKGYVSEKHIPKVTAMAALPEVAGILRLSGASTAALAAPKPAAIKPALKVVAKPEVVEEVEEAEVVEEVADDPVDTVAEELAAVKAKAAAKVVAKPAAKVVAKPAAPDEAQDALEKQLDSLFG